MKIQQTLSRTASVYEPFAMREGVFTVNLVQMAGSPKLDGRHAVEITLDDSRGSTYYDVECYALYFDSAGLTDLISKLQTARNFLKEAEMEDLICQNEIRSLYE